jgi:glycosyltransferase involved in cell wall biosynthesis
MDWSAECAAVIPCLNEAQAIGSVVHGVRSFVPNVIVVDDGSTDGTGRLATAAGAEVLTHPSCRGKGAALQTAREHAHRRGFSWAVMLDGDGQHAPESIPAFFQCADRTAARLVVGNRMHEAHRMPRVRRWVNRWMSRRLSQAAGEILPDSQCGFRLIHLPTWSALPIRTAHFEIESEVLITFVRAGFPVEFVPIRAIYKDEQSKIHPWRDTVRWVRWWLSLAKAGPAPKAASVANSRSATSPGSADIQAMRHPG